MKLKSYDETIKYYKDLFYTHWYGKGLKEKIISFIEKNFVDIEGFSLCLSYELFYEFKPIERIYFFKFLRSELWSMGMNLTKSVNEEFILTKKSKKDQYSKFLNYIDYNYASSNIINEISYIQMITGKTYDEALKIFNGAIEIKPEKENVKKEESSKKNKSKKKKEENNKTINNVIIMESNVNSTSLEEAKVPNDVAEAIEQTLATDDCE